MDQNQGTHKDIVERYWYVDMTRKLGLHECKWPSYEPKINLEIKLTGAQASLWKSIIKLPADQPRVFSGKVIKGFGRGSRLLRMPTGKISLQLFCSKYLLNKRNKRDSGSYDARSILRNHGIRGQGAEHGPTREKIFGHNVDRLESTF